MIYTYLPDIFASYTSLIGGLEMTETAFMFGLQLLVQPPGRRDISLVIKHFVERANNVKDMRI